MKVAVLVPVYNAAGYIPQCLDSILAQTYPDVEIFCNDDGSTDNALEVCREYEKRLPQRVHVSAWKNHGLASNLNRLLDNLPDGFDAYTFVDCDDYIHPKAIEVMVAAMEKHNVDVVECGVFDIAPDAVYPDGCAKELQDFGCVIDDMSIYRLKETSRGRWILHWNKLYRREAVKGIRFREGLRYEADYFFSYEIHAAVKRKAIVFSNLHAYRQNPNSMTSDVHFDDYIESAVMRVKLSLNEFYFKGRIPENEKGKFLDELSKDAYRMIVRKNLKHNRDASGRRECFAAAGEGLREIEALCSVLPTGLNPVQHLIWNACRNGCYPLARGLSFLT